MTEQTAGSSAQHALNLDRFSSLRRKLPLKCGSVLIVDRNNVAKYVKLQKTVRFDFYLKKVEVPSMKPCGTLDIIQISELNTGHNIESTSIIIIIIIFF